MDGYHTPFPCLLTHTNAALLKYDASSVLSRHLMSESNLFLVDLLTATVKKECASPLVHSIIISFYLRRQTALDEVRGFPSIICRWASLSVFQLHPLISPQSLNDVLLVEDFSKFRFHEAHTVHIDM